MIIKFVPELLWNADSRDYVVIEKFSAVSLLIRNIRVRQTRKLLEEVGVSVFERGIYINFSHISRL